MKNNKKKWLCFWLFLDEYESTPSPLPAAPSLTLYDVEKVMVEAGAPLTMLQVSVWTSSQYQDFFTSNFTTGAKNLHEIPKNILRRKTGPNFKLQLLLPWVWKSINLIKFLLWEDICIEIFHEQFYCIFMTYLTLRCGRSLIPPPPLGHCKTVCMPV